MCILYWTIPCLCRPTVLLSLPCPCVRAGGRLAVGGRECPFFRAATKKPNTKKPSPPLTPTPPLASPARTPSLPPQHTHRTTMQRTVARQPLKVRGAVCMDGHFPIPGDPPFTLLVRRATATRRSSFASHAVEDACLLAVGARWGRAEGWACGAGRPPKGPPALTPCCPPPPAAPPCPYPPLPPLDTRRTPHAPSRGDDGWAREGLPRRQPPRARAPPLEEEGGGGAVVPASFPTRLGPRDHGPAGRDAPRSGARVACRAGGRAQR